MKTIKLKGIGVGVDRGRGGIAKPNGSPSSLTLVSVTDTTATFSWVNGATNQDGTYVFYCTTVGGTYLLGDTIVGNGTQGLIEDLSPNTTYYVKVVHYKGSKLSSYSSVVSTTTSDTSHILQKLDFTLDATQKLLNDISGLNNHAKLVKSNCYKGNSLLNTSIITNDPVGDDMTFYDFSAEFLFSAASTGSQIPIGRVNGGTTNFLLSSFVIVGGALKYYSASGAANSTVTLIASITTNQVYHVKCSVVNSTGNISWEIDGTPGSATFTNRTPNTNQDNDSVAIARGISAFYLAENSKVFGIKYYRSINYANLTHYWPCSSGGGLKIYDVIGSKDIDLTLSLWSTQDEFHYNIIKGFELYGNSDANSSIIRVPYRNDGTKISPTISGYTKFADCDPGLFHNFAETGVKRNYLGTQSLIDAGIASTNIIYYGHLTGYSGHGFCKNHLGNETEYSLFSTVANRLAYFGYESYAQFMRDDCEWVIIAGSSGKIHNTNIKNAANKTIVASEFYEIFIKEGTYNLTNPTTEMPIIPSANCGITAGANTYINGYLAPDTAKETIAGCCVLNNLGKSYRFNLLKGTCQNMRYYFLDDIKVLNAVKRTNYCDFEHLGNAEALLIDPTVWSICDAVGTGYFSGADIIHTESRFFGHVSGTGKGRGFAAHGSLDAESAPAVHKFIGGQTGSNGDYSFRWSPYPTGQNDRVEFSNHNFNGKNILLDPRIDTYDPMADKINLFKDPADVAPEIVPETNYAYIGLGIASISNKSLLINTGTVTTLLFSSPKTLTAHSLTGRKNISTTASLSGWVGLKGLLGDCSSVNKILSIKLDGIDTNITFNQDYSAMTNAQVLASINAINADILFTEYNYCNNATVENLT